MGVKLYGMPMSRCTATAMIVLEEKQVDYEFVHVHLFNAQHKQPSFLSKHPFAQIPALEDADDLTIFVMYPNFSEFESRAISAYIAENYKYNNATDLLRQGDLKEATLVKVWMEVEAQRFNPAIRPIIYEYFVNPLSGKTSDQTIIDQNLEKLGKVLDVYDEKLRSTKYLAGDYYTLADLHHFPCTHYFMKSPYASLINSRLRVKAWWEDISSRPAITKIAENMEYGKN